MVPKAVTTAARRQPEVSFLVLALLFSWALWIPVILSQRGLIPFSIQPSPIGSFGPALSAIAVSWLIGNRGRDVVSSLRSSSFSRFLIPGVILLPFALYTTSAVIHAVIRREYPQPQNLDQWPQLVVLIPVVLILGGPLGEEIGWRGFLLPRLQERFSPVVSSILVAGAWLVWHLPLFWLEGATQQGSSIAMFAVMVVAFSLLFTWVFNHSQGSLWPVLLFHTSINTVSVVFPTVLPEVSESSMHDHLLVFVACLVAVGATTVTRGALGKLESD